MKIRVSVDNLATRLLLEGTDQTRIFGILNRKALEQGDRVVGGLGGGAQITPSGRDFLIRKFGTEFCDDPFEARFVIEEEHMEEVLTFFEHRDPEMFEIDATREIREELSTRELPIQSGPILTHHEVSLVHTRYFQSARQPLGSSKYRARDVPGVKTVRLFHVFELRVQKEQWSKILSSPVIYVFSFEELAELRAGKEVVKPDGTRMGDNIF